MADHGESIVQQCPPSPSRETCDKDGWRAAFYPGFVRRLTVTAAGAETVLYDQGEGIFCLPAGATKPWGTSVVELRGGPADRDVTLTVDDPRHEIESIVVRFKPSVSSAARRTDDVDEDGEEWRIHDTPTLCPPTCPLQGQD